MGVRFHPPLPGRAARTATVMVVALLAPGWANPASVRGQAPRFTPPPGDQKPMPWIGKPYAEWPQMVLTNRGTFKGRNAPSWRKGNMASAFLIRATENTIVAATTKHLLTREWGGIDPPIPVKDLDRVVQSWVIFPRQTIPPEGPTDVIRLRGLALGAEHLGETDDEKIDWLFFKVDRTEFNLPGGIVALPIREERLKVGEKLYFLGVPYKNPPNPRQNVYTGKVVKSQRYAFDFQLIDGVNLRGFSGAPILDANGYVVGSVGAIRGVPIAPIADKLRRQPSTPED